MSDEIRAQLAAALEENKRLKKTLDDYMRENDDISERARAGWEAADAAEARLLENITGMS